jgi:tRNA threonylcarbamoyladenosine biosynthesis protein TsaE
MPPQPIPSADRFPWRRRAGSPAATAALAAAAAELLRGGEALLLWGPLGAGKTFFVQELCRALGVPDEVTSPTFTLAARYEGRLTVHHLDFYRPAPDANLTEVGIEAVLEEVESGRAVLAAEWPRPLLSLLGPRLELLALPGDGPAERLWHLRGEPEPPAAWQRLFAGERP